MADCGAAKSFKTLDDGGLLYYKDDYSGFTTSVERVLCIDGLEIDTQKQAMTLLVLKIVVASNTEEKVSSVVATLNPTDQKKGEKANPDVVAWAPFKGMTRSNETQPSVKVGTGYEYEVAWTQTYFDEGHAYPTMSPTTGRRSGVRWVFKANPIQVMGVPPEMFVGILFKRETSAPYLVNFDIRVKGGKTHNLIEGVAKTMGLGPGRSKPLLVSPSSKPVTRYEGEYMLPQVDGKNLGKQRAEGDPTNLTLNALKRMRMVLYVPWGGENDNEDLSYREGHR
ncbi:hypothetical protein F5Y10DRAFT_273844 [Nemania abortiva]|nr:hypothetical protein F5Y10DRAFT_273844 [Nemania abortiva]